LKEKLAKVLDDRAHRGTPLEQRFAKVARPRYAVYRNLAEHEPNTFRFSFHEARHFLAGMRALEDLGKQIRLQRDKNPNERRCLIVRLVIKATAG
jgi:hypothetical protein